MLAVGLGHATLVAGIRTYYTTANTMHFYLGPSLLINEVGHLPLPREAGAPFFRS